MDTFPYFWNLDNKKYQKDQKLEHLKKNLNLLLKIVIKILVNYPPLDNVKLLCYIFL